MGAAAGLAVGAEGLRLPGAARIADSARPSLEVALEAWRWIDASTVRTDHGITWPADPLDPASVGDTLYTHGTGVLPFLLELFHRTQDEEYLDAARAAADHLAARLADVRGSGLYVGLAGVAFVLEETHRASGDPVYRDHAALATDHLIRRAQTIGEGLAWPERRGADGAVEVNDVVSGTAGTALTLLYLADRLGHTASLETARRAGYRLVERGFPGEPGLRWDIYDGYAREMPNFSHGTAGIAYTLAKLAGATREPAFLEAALGGAEYLRSIATVRDDTYLIYHNAPEGLDLYYLAWCHGPVGTNRLFHALHQGMGDEGWARWIGMGARGIMATGVPEVRTPGFWENVSQCGGSAGLGDYFLTMHRLTGDAEYRRFVDRLNADLMRRSSRGEPGRKWIQSEHRVQPDLLVAQTGYMQGAAGIGKYFLHLDAMDRDGAGPAIVLPDAPY